MVWSYTGSGTGNGCRSLPPWANENRAGSVKRYGAPCTISATIANARTVRALAMVAEIVHGAPYRFTDPARFSFAHGGKDRHPFPVPLPVYDQTIQVLKSAVQKAKLGRAEELGALKRLDDQARQLERHASGPPVQELIARERQHSPSYGGRSVFGWERGRPSAKIGNVDRR